MVRINAKPTKKTTHQIADKKLNAIYAAAFSTPPGKQLLEHIKNELGLVMPLGSTKIEIVHREGGRFVLYNIINRIEKGKRNE